jgi:subtilisin family serine protease
MLKHIIGSLLLVTILAFAAQAESNYWYYNNDGTALSMEVFDNLVAVRVDPNLPDWDAEHFARDRECLIDSFTIEAAPGNFFLFGIEPGYSLNYAMTLLCLDESVLMVNPVVRDSYGDRAKLDNSLSVIYKPTTTPAQIDSLQQAWQLTVREVLEDSAFQVYFLDHNERTSYDITILAQSYYESGLCLVVEPNLTMVGRYDSDDPYYSEQWPLKNTGQHGGTPGADIDWEIAEQYENPLFSPLVVAVIDAGFQMDHEDLPPNWARRPYDAVGPNVNWDYIPDYYPGTECGDTRTHCWHGTATLGVLLAYANNGIGLAGTESRVKVMPIKMGDVDGRFNRQSIERAVNWASLSPGPAQIIVMTFNAGSFQSAVLEQMFRARYLAGVPLIAAAGNLGQVTYPASSRYVLAVGMSDKNDNVPSLSGQGPLLDLVAPGVDVWSLDLMGSDGVNPGLPGMSCDANQNYACGYTGTSFSAPLVAGIAAKLLLHNPWLLGDHVKDSAEVMYDYLRRSCEREQYGVANNDYRRVNDAVGWGRVNAERAFMVSCTHCGDADGSGSVDISDVIFILAHIFSGGAAPADCRYRKGMGDANGDGSLDISDCVFLIARIFSGGAAPHCQGM